MHSLSLVEEQVLLAFRRTRDALYIGIDHHGDQLTVACVKGGELLERQLTRPGYNSVATKVFEQDVFGYLALLDFLAERFPDVPREHYRFLSEPSYAKPCCHFLFASGFGRHQVLWADPRRVGQFRKLHHLTSSGKNDADDARAMVAMLHHAASQPSAPVELFELPEVQPLSAALGGLAEEHFRLGRQAVELKNRIAQLVMLLFPELRRVWANARQYRAPGVGTYVRRELDLFTSLTPMRLLAAFPSPKAVAEAGFEGVWKVIGGVGVKRATIQQIVDLARVSAGVDDPVESRRLALLVEELAWAEARKARYNKEIRSLLASDPVFASLAEIPWLAPHHLATVIGAIGNPHRFRNVDAVKRYLNIAPRPMPQTGALDDQGRPVRIWRFPANTYARENGQKRLVYRCPGRQDVRNVVYLAFESLVVGHKRQPTDPFVKYYLHLKATHQGRTRWMARVRWKVGAKLVGTIYHCWKAGRTFDPAHTHPTEALALA